MKQLTTATQRTLLSRLFHFPGFVPSPNQAQSVESLIRKGLVLREDEALSITEAGIVAIRQKV